MKKIAALIIDTFREIYARKVILAIIIVEIAALVITALFLFSDGMQSVYRGSRELSKTGAAHDSALVAERPESSKSGGETPEESTLLDDSSSVQDAVALASRHAKELEDSALLNDSSIDSLLAQTGKPAKKKSADSTTKGVAETATAPIDSVDTLARHGSATFSTGLSSDTVRKDLRTPGEIMLEETVVNPLAFYGLAICAATIFLGIFATAGIIPSMMEKGTIDLLLSKPVSRSAIFAGRALGGAIAITLNLLLFTTAVWVLYGLASGLWYTPFLTYTVAVSAFGYLTVYSGILLMNVLSESWVLPLSIAYAHVVILSPVLTSRETILYNVIESNVLRSIIDGIYYILPQTHDLGQTILADAIAHQWISNFGPFIQGGIFMIVALALAMWRFSRKDF